VTDEPPDGILETVDSHEEFRKTLNSVPENLKLTFLQNVMQVYDVGYRLTIALKCKK